MPGPFSGGRSTKERPRGGTFLATHAATTATCRLAGGQGGIRTRGGCYTTHAFQACALNHSATCPGAWSAVVIAWLSHGATFMEPGDAFPGPARLARVRFVVGGAMFLVRALGWLLLA